jgi:glucose-6-phosphate isomerase
MVDNDRLRCLKSSWGACSLAVDFSYMSISNADILKHLVGLERAVKDMRSLESGEVVNIDEDRQVGHYWLRNPALAPTLDIRREIEHSVSSITEFVRKLLRGDIRTVNGGLFSAAVVVGIGGSALGPQLIVDALGGDGLSIKFIDNTDPAGIERTINSLDSLESTLFIVASKSGGTRETYNGEMYIKHRLQTSGLLFGKQMVAITLKDSNLYSRARNEQWLDIFEIWDWVGGRTSVTSAVGLLPAGLAGVDTAAFIQGAHAMDSRTRINYNDPNVVANLSDAASSNPALMMALSWLVSGGGDKNMVLLPYCDQLLLLSRYLQQLVMESLGKKYDRNGEIVYQGISVFGNKGSTDQHAFVQQLRDGRNDFFAVFIQVLEDGGGSVADFCVEPNITMGDYLFGFLVGTRAALWQENRASYTISIKRCDAFHLGALIALFERAVGYYASLININAYHQPGVEAGKRAAIDVIDIQRQVLATLADAANGLSLDSLCACVDSSMDGDCADIVRSIVERLVVNNRLKTFKVLEVVHYKMVS